MASLISHIRLCLLLWSELFRTIALLLGVLRDFIVGFSVEQTREGCLFVLFFFFLMLNKSRNEFVIVKTILLARKFLISNFQLVAVLDL